MLLLNRHNSIFNRSLARRLQKRVLDGYQDARRGIRSARNRVHVHGLTAKHTVDNRFRVAEIWLVVARGNNGDNSDFATLDSYRNRDNALVAARRARVGAIVQRANIHAEVRLDYRVVRFLLFGSCLGGLQLFGLRLGNFHYRIWIVRQRLVRTHRKRYGNAR